jgi:hypothetical protein
MTGLIRIGEARQARGAVLAELSDGVGAVDNTAVIDTVRASGEGSGDQKRTLIFRDRGLPDEIYEDTGPGSGEIGNERFRYMPPLR